MDGCSARLFGLSAACVMDSSDLQRSIGRLEGRVASMENDISEVKESLDSMGRTRKGIMYFLTAAGGAVGYLLSHWVKP